MKCFLIGFMATCVMVLQAQHKPQTDLFKTRNKFGHVGQSVTYYIYVPSFSDFNNDSIGDIKGVIDKLTYIKNLGAEAIILSPLYWTADSEKKGAIDFTTVDPAFGTLSDLKELIDEAHKLNIAVILSFNFNCTGTSHPWFMQCRKDTIYQSHYIWKKNADHNLSKKKFYVQSGYSGAYYSYRGKNLPCLNYANTDVCSSVLTACKFWLNECKPDGMKFDEMDALYAGNTERALAWWGELSSTLRKINPGLILMAHTTDDGSFNEQLIQLKFNCIYHQQFVSMIQQVVLQGKVNDVLVSLNRINDLFYKSWKGFLPFIYSGSEYSIRLLNGMNQLQAKATLSLLFTLSQGTALFYGDELGYQGDVKTKTNTEAFAWHYSGVDDNRTFFIKAELNNDSAVVPYAVQINNGTSLYHHVAKLATIRKHNDVFYCGRLASAEVNDKRIFAFYRDLKSRRALIIQNVSNQAVMLKSDKLTSDPLNLLFSTSTYTVTGDGQINLSPYATIIFETQSTK